MLGVRKPRTPCRWCRRKDHRPENCPEKRLEGAENAAEDKEDAEDDEERSDGDEPSQGPAARVIQVRLRLSTSSKLIIHQSAACATSSTSSPSQSCASTSSPSPTCGNHRSRLAAGPCAFYLPFLACPNLPPSSPRPQPVQFRSIRRVRCTGSAASVSKQPPGECSSLGPAERLIKPLAVAIGHFLPPPAPQAPQLSPVNLPEAYGVWGPPQAIQPVGFPRIRSWTAGSLTESLGCEFSSIPARHRLLNPPGKRHGPRLGRSRV